MNRPDPTWVTEYRHDRRTTRHRCRACNKILTEGESVIMCRVTKGTLAIHASHADRPVMPDRPSTWADQMTIWGLESLKRLGYRVPELA